MMIWSYQADYRSKYIYTLTQLHYAKIITLQYTNIITSCYITLHISVVFRSAIMLLALCDTDTRTSGIK